MVVQIRAGREAFAADLTHVRLLSAMDTPMCDDVQGNVKVITFSCVIRWWYRLELAVKRLPQI